MQVIKNSSWCWYCSLGIDLKVDLGSVDIQQKDSADRLSVLSYGYCRFLPLGMVSSVLELVSFKKCIISRATLIAMKQKISKIIKIIIDVV